MVFLMIGMGAESYADSGTAGARLPRVARITPGDVLAYEQAFIRGLTESGFTPGKSLELEDYSTSGDLAAGPGKAAELAARNVDVIYAAPGILAKHVIEAQNKSGKKTPIVVLTWDPVKEGLVGSAAQPGGNVTGVGGVHSPAELLVKQVELVHDMLPAAKKVVCLLDKSWHREFSDDAKAALTQTKAATGLHIDTIELATVSEVDRKLKMLARHPPDALIVPSVALFSITRSRILQFAARYRLPAIYGEELFVYEGGLVSYGASVADMNRRAGVTVAKILRGADPATTPVDYNTRFRLVVNLRSAKAQGIAIPAAILHRADEVIE